jgi:O-antigen/teichoic acid export membrane protein
VTGLSILNVGSKIVWGAGVVGAILLGAGLKTIGVAILLTEAARATGMAMLASRNLRLKASVNMRSAAIAIAGSMQFYVGHVAQTVYSRIDVSIMSFMASDVEVGWYGAASNLAGLSLLLAPLIGWVILPLSSRAAARSQEELTIVMRRAMEFVLALSIPVALLLGLGADVIVHAAFGQAFEPAVSSLRILAPTFILTYVTMVSASMLIRLERGWALTWITISAMFIAPLLNLWLIPRGLAAWGPGGAGDAAAISLPVTEVYAVSVMTWLLGRRAFDRRTMRMVGKTLAIACLTIVTDRLLQPLGAWRLVVDAVLYVGLVIASGAVDVATVVSMTRDVLKRGKKSS